MFVRTQTNGSLALLLRKELQDRLAGKGARLEWGDVIPDLDNLVEMEIAINGKRHVFRSPAKGAVTWSFRLAEWLFRPHCGPLQKPSREAEGRDTRIFLNR